MIFEALRKLFGVNSRSPDEHASRNWGNSDEGFPSHPFSNSQPLDVFDMETDINRIHDMMEQQMRSVMESFSFMFGGPGFRPDHGFRPESGNEDGDDSSHRRGGIFPFFFGLPGLPGPSWNGTFDGVPNHGMRVPALPGPDGNLEPRDEVLKPQFRKQVSKKDEDLDAMLQEQGAGAIINMLKPNQNEEFNPPSRGFSWSWGGSSDPQISSSSTVTIYRNINGHSTYEKIICHPDGRVDRTVLENDGNSNAPGSFKPLD